MRARLLRALQTAMASGWSEAAIIAVLEGPARDATGNVLPWCHACDKPITPEHELVSPAEEVRPDGLEPWENSGLSVSTVGCARCLTFPAE